MNKKDLETLKKDELLQMAREYNLPVNERNTKEQIIEKIIEHGSVAETRADPLGNEESAVINIEKPILPKEPANHEPAIRDTAPQQNNIIKEEDFAVIETKDSELPNTEPKKTDLHSAIAEISQAHNTDEKSNTPDENQQDNTAVIEKPLEDMSKAELYAQAKKDRIKNISWMNKNELLDALQISRDEKDVTEILESMPQQEKQMARAVIKETLVPKQETKNALQKLRKGPRKYRTGGKLVINAEDKFKTKITEEDKWKGNVRQSHLRGNILTGKVAAVSSEGDHTVLTALYGDYSVLIPLEFFGSFPEHLLEEPEKLRTQLNARLGSEVDFIIIGEMKDGKKLVAGNRIKAMEKRKDEWWFSFTTKDQWRLQENAVVEARIVATFKNGILIELGGVETFIRNSQLDYLTIDDARDVYSAGDKIDVKLTGIRRNPDTRDIRYNASVKLVKNDRSQEIFEATRLDSIHLGTVIKMFYDRGPGKSPAFLVKTEMGQVVYCLAGHLLPKREGDRVQVKITGKYEEKERITGIITHIARR